MLRFNGTWKIDIDNASKWDTVTKTYIPDAVGEEIITIRVDDGVQNYEVLYGDDPVIRMGYTARFDVAEWVPYSVREIVSAPGVDQATAVSAFRDRIGANEASNARNFQVGKPYGLIRLVYVDERTHYRIGKAEDGRPQNVLLRRLAEDGRSYMTSLLDAEGVVSRIRPFIRVT
jgi:hypothetical protein